MQIGTATYCRGIASVVKRGQRRIEVAEFGIVHQGACSGDQIGIDGLEPIVKAICEEREECLDRCLAAAGSKLRMWHVTDFGGPDQYNQVVFARFSQKD